MAETAPMELDVVAVADAVEKATAATGAVAGSGNTATTVAADVPGVGPPPAPLPPGWLIKQSRSNPMYYYYYDMETGLTTWDPPVNPARTMTTAAEVEEVLASLPVNTLQNGDQEQNQNGQPDENSASTTKDGADEERYTKESSSSSSSNKRRKTKKSPEQVRVLHILKKHKDSRRPSSWRQKTITQTREEAHEELKSLLELLEDDADDPEALRATFEEIARTESDCSSAKRGGDLGYFTRGKMQPPFENASFSLNKGELTKEIVDSSSGSHIILRIG